MADDEKTLKIEVNYRESRPDSSGKGGDTSKRDDPSPPSPPTSPPTEPPSPLSPPTDGGSVSPPPPTDAAPPTGGSGAPPVPPEPPVTPAAGAAAASAIVPAAAGEAAASLAPAAVEAGGALAMLGSVVPPLLIVMGALAVATAALITAFTLVTNAVNAFIADLHDFSPEVNVAEGMAQAAEFQNKFENAQNAGSEMADFIGDQTEIGNLLRDIKTNLFETFYPVINAMNESVIQILKAVKWCTDWLKWFGEQFIGMLDTIARGMAQLPLVHRLGVLLHEYLTKSLEDMEDRDAKDFQKELLDALNPKRQDIQDAIAADEPKPKRP